MKTKVGIEKPLAEWTLWDVKEACVAHGGNCAPCPLYHHCGKVFRKWDLSEKPKFTEQEIQDAKNIMRIWGTESMVIERNGFGDVIIILQRNTGSDGIIVDKNLFPSIGKGEEYRISEIACDADD